MLRQSPPFKDAATRTRQSVAETASCPTSTRRRRRHPPKWRTPRPRTRRSRRSMDSTVRCRTATCRWSFAHSVPVQGRRFALAGRRTHPFPARAIRRRARLSKSVATRSRLDAQPSPIACAYFRPLHPRCRATRHAPMNKMGALPSTAPREPARRQGTRARPTIRGVETLYRHPCQLPARPKA